MNFKKIALCTTALLAIASSCFAMESGYYYRVNDGNLYSVTVLSRDGKLKGNDQPVHYEFVDMRNSADEVYSSNLIKTSKDKYSTSSGFVTNTEARKGQYVDGYFRGNRVAYDRMAKQEGDFTIENLGNGKIKVSSNAGYVKGFGFDGIYESERTFLGASDGLALHALETIAKETKYLAIGDIDYKYRIFSKEDGSGYSIQAWQDNTLAGAFDVRIELGVVNFMWNDNPIELFRIIDAPKG